jgi:hypothetical protein
MTPPDTLNNSKLWPLPGPKSCLRRPRQRRVALGADRGPGYVRRSYPRIVEALSVAARPPTLRPEPRANHGQSEILRGRWRRSTRSDDRGRYLRRQGPAASVLCRGFPRRCRLRARLPNRSPARSRHGGRGSRRDSALAGARWGSDAVLPQRRHEHGADEPDHRAPLPRVPTASAATRCTSAWLASTSR